MVNGQWTGEWGLLLAKTYFSTRLSTGILGEEGEKRSKKGLTEYMAVDKRLKIDVTDAKVVRGTFEESDLYAVLMDMAMNNRVKVKEQTGSGTGLSSEYLRKKK